MGLHRDERRLFHDRLRQLDRKVLAGMSKISWAAPKSTLDAYCTEALRFVWLTGHVFDVSMCFSNTLSCCTSVTCLTNYRPQV